MNELDLEELAMAWFKDIGYQTLHGPDIEPGGSAQERAEYQDVILWDRFDACYCPIESFCISWCSARCKTSIPPPIERRAKPRSMQQNLPRDVS